MLKPYRLKAFPPCPKTLSEFGWQLNQGGYSKILNYELNNITAVTVIDLDGETHVLFYDQDLLDEYFKNISHIFVDATFQTRPRIQDCTQLLNILAVINNCVRQFMFY